ncbi:MAG: hypothetical protein R2867_26975 [Caldilineaceae bacterium]
MRILQRPEEDSLRPGEILSPPPPMWADNTFPKAAAIIDDIERALSHASSHVRRAIFSIRQVDGGVAHDATQNR